MASNELDKLKSKRTEDSLPVISADNELTIEAYLRNSLGDMEAYVPKVNGVALASRLGKDPKIFSSEPLDKNALMERDEDEWGQNFETDLHDRKRQRKPFPSIALYLAIALLSGGISGGALLYLLVHYAAPQGAESSDAAPAAPAIPYGKVSDPPAHEQSPSFNLLPKAGLSPPASAERSQTGLTGYEGSQSRPPESDRKAVEVTESAGSVPIAVDANAREAGAGDKIAAIAPLAEAAPRLAPPSGPKEKRSPPKPASLIWASRSGTPSFRNSLPIKSRRC